MGNYTIFQMFENPRKGTEASKKFYNKCSENSRSQIVFRTYIFRKSTLGAPDHCFARKAKYEMESRICFYFQVPAVKSPICLSKQERVMAAAFFRSDKGLTLETSAFRISVRWPIYIINSVDKTKFLYTTSPPTQHHSFFRIYPLNAAFLVHQ